MNDEELAEYDRETADLVSEAAKAVADATSRATAAKHESAAARKQQKKAEAALLKLIADRAEERGRPSLLSLLSVAGKGAPPEDLYREYPLSRWARFGLSAALVDKLSDGVVKGDARPFEIRTVGDLADFHQPRPGGSTRRLTDVKGIGEAAADDITRAEGEFWKWWAGGGAAEFARENGYGDEAPAGPGSEGSGRTGAVGDSDGETD